MFKMNQSIECLRHSANQHFNKTCLKYINVNVECDLAQDERRRHMPQYDSIKSSLCRERRKFVPGQPYTD